MREMKTLSNLVLLIVVGGGLGMFLGSVNRTVDLVGADYYWYAVCFGYLACIAAYLFGRKRGYTQPGVLAAIMLVIGPVALPVMLTVLPVESWKGEASMAWLITVGTFCVIASCGFTGVKQPS